jgi:hypothetical protein
MAPKSAMDKDSVVDTKTNSINTTTIDMTLNKQRPGI